jgi:peptidoglycan hydrolase-like protein with peptidoglycan-binding domain
MHQFITRYQRSFAALATVVLISTGCAFVPNVARADTNADLEAQIQALLAIVAQLQAQLNGGGSTSGVGCGFTRDLGYGMSGSDVACLQNYLISTGYSIPAGPTGNYYSQTQAAVAVWQAAHGVYPANGYWSSTSRDAYQNLYNGNNGGNGNDHGNDNLHGGSANLSSFSLDKSDDSTSLREGQSNQRIGEISFRVRGGDVNVTDVALRFHALSDNESDTPWTYFDTIKLYDGSEVIGEEDASSRSDWDNVDGNGSTDVYELNFNNIDDIIREDDTANWTVRVTTQDNISNSDLDQTFNFFVPDNGIEAEDSTGDTDRIGDKSDTVRLEFDN